MSTDNFGNEDPRSELQSIHAKSDHITNESLESTRRMRQFAVESQDAGTKTLEMLDGQGKQLDDIEAGMDKISSDMKKARKDVTRMGKWWSGLVPSKKKGPEPDVKLKGRGDKTKDRKDPGKVQTVQQHPSDIHNQNGLGSGKEGGYIVKITNDAREDEMDENLKEVSTIVGSLRNMAIDMGNEIGRHNDKLDNINTKVLANQTVIDEANQKATKLLKS